MLGYRNQDRKSVYRMMTLGASFCLWICCVVGNSIEVTAAGIQMFRLLRPKCVIVGVLQTTICVVLLFTYKQTHPIHTNAVSDESISGPKHSTVLQTTTKSLSSSVPKTQTTNRLYAVCFDLLIRKERKILPNRNKTRKSG